MEEHYEALVSDFQREYGIDLFEELDDMDIRHLRMLLDGLSPNGTLYREFNPDWYWTWEAELLATIAQLVDRMDRRLAAVYSKGSTAPMRPIHIPRPIRKLIEHEQNIMLGTTKEKFIQMIRRDRRKG